MYRKRRAKLVDSKSKIGHTPLHLACRFGHLPVVLLLLAEDADINAKDNDDNTPLHKVQYPIQGTPYNTGLTGERAYRNQ